MTQPAYMGGPVNPAVSGPGGGLLQPSNYSYPLTSGLLSSIMPQQQPANSWSQLAYQMAGSPKQGGMYASVGTPPAPSGSGSSASSLAALLPLLGGLLGGSTGSNGIAGALQSLLGGSSAQQLRASGNTIPSTPVPGSFPTTGNFGNTPFSPLDPGQLTNPDPTLGGLFTDPGFNMDTGYTSFNDPVPDDLGGLADIPQFSFNSAGGQATTPSQAPSQSSLSLGKIANAGLSGYSLANAASAGSGAGIAGAAANLASSLGAPKSITAPVSAGAGIAGLLTQLATGQYGGAASSLLSMGGKAAGIPSDISQPVSLLMSILTGNPLGMAVNGAKVGGGLLNVVGGRNYDGSWTPSQGQLSQDEQAATDAGNQLIAGGGPGATTAGAPQQVATQTTQPTFTPAQLAQMGQQQAYAAATNLSLAGPGVYGEQPTNMMNQGESSIPVAPMTPEALAQLISQMHA